MNLILELIGYASLLLIVFLLLILLRGKIGTRAGAMRSPKFAAARGVKEWSLGGKASANSVVSGELAQSEYVETLKFLEKFALIQYSFSVIAAYIFFDVSATSLFGMPLPDKKYWLLVGTLIGIGSNFYAARLIDYLSTLLWLRPEKRRVFRFLAWNAKWLFNPFRMWLIRKPPVDAMWVYVFAVQIGVLLINPVFPSPSGFENYLNEYGQPLKSFVYLLPILHLYSLLHLGNTISRHGNLLWNGRFAKSDDRHRYEKNDRFRRVRH